jgi:cytochrome c5
MWLAAGVVTGLVFAAGLATPAAQQRAGEKQMWDGVFTVEQATRGKALFDNSCSRCHNQALTGSERGPALKGELFWSHWEDDALLTLFTKIRDTMPQGGVESVPDEGKLDILAHILSLNDVPPGKEELSLTPGVLESIFVTRKGGAARPTVANFTLVQSVGCLARGPNQEWLLTRASEPATTRDETPTPANVEAARSKALGSLDFRLLSVLAPYGADGHVGHKMEARGLLLRTPEGNRLNLTSLQMLDASCGS